MVSIIIFIKSDQIMAFHPYDHLVLLYYLQETPMLHHTMLQLYSILTFFSSLLQWLFFHLEHVVPVAPSGITENSVHSFTNATYRKVDRLLWWNDRIKWHLDLPWLQVFESPPWTCCCACPCLSYTGEPST